MRGQRPPRRLAPATRCMVALDRAYPLRERTARPAARQKHEIGLQRRRRATNQPRATINQIMRPKMFGRTTIRPLHAWALTSVLALAGVGIAVPSHAQTAYDGPWTVVVTTRGGTCQPNVRYGVDISNGQIIIPAGGLADVQGRVTPRGAVNVRVRSDDEWAVGSGHLGRLAGGGVWHGKGSSGFCDGTWAAQRRGPATAQATGTPLYNYAPGPASQAPAGVAPSVAACEARFRSYDPATGTYLGYDGLQHRCP